MENIHTDVGREGLISLSLFILLWFISDLVYFFTFHFSVMIPFYPVKTCNWV